MLFISYSRRDAEAAQQLHDDLEASGLDVWMDHEIRGGQQWWDVILEQIRNSDVFVLALSLDSVRSKACSEELRYAQRLGKQILPVQVRDMDLNLVPDVVGATDIIDYLPRNPTRLRDVTLAALEGQRNAAPLPDPLPTPSAPPVTDLKPIREQLAEDSLDQRTQEALVAAIKEEIPECDEPATLRSLVDQFMARRDLFAVVQSDLRSLEASIPIPMTRDIVSAVRNAAPPRPLSELDDDSEDRLRSLEPHLEHLTPILGRGMTDSILGPLRVLAAEWAERYESPTKLRRHDDLPFAAQFVQAMNSTATLISALDKGLRAHIRTLYSDVVSDETADELGQLLEAAWQAQRAGGRHDPYTALAQLPCRIYVTTNPWDLMAQALRATPHGEGFKDPVVEVCRWRPDVYDDDWPESIFDPESDKAKADPDYTPSVARPLVYHVFGVLGYPKSLALSTDDYLDFLMHVTEHRDQLVPGPVLSALANSARLLLGFGLDDIELRVLLRALRNNQGGDKLGDYSHVGAQSETSFGTARSKRERRYLENYARKTGDPAVDVFWGTVDELTAGLIDLWESAS